MSFEPIVEKYFWECCRKAMDEISDTKESSTLKLIFRANLVDHIDRIQASTTDKILEESELHGFYSTVLTQRDMEESEVFYDSFKFLTALINSIIDVSYNFATINQAAYGESIRLGAVLHVCAPVHLAFKRIMEVHKTVWESRARTTSDCECSVEQYINASRT